jgi:hypothetical protein
MGEIAENPQANQETATVIAPVVKNYTSKELRNALGSERFQTMQPNYNRPEALLPKDLDETLVNEVVEAVATPKLVAARHDFRFDADEELKDWHQELPGGGELSYLGAGEMRFMFRLTKDGKEMAVGLTKNYLNETGLQVPEDSRLTLDRNSAAGKLMTYSDLRTYLVLPVAQADRPYYGVVFQEYAPYSPLKTGLSPISSKIAEGRARRHIKEYCREQGCKLRKISDDIGAKKHHFLVNGEIAIIDAPVDVSTIYS